jgi:endogenous inhibitor of DNA gyrase (YacG/DUF329 family)
MPVESGKGRKVHCPQCNAAILWSMENPFRPFCSERCKLIDLGQWASGAYRIPQAERDNGKTEDEEP